jgi:hypothetical protein
MNDFYMCHDLIRMVFYSKYCCILVTLCNLVYWSSEIWGIQCHISEDGNLDSHLILCRHISFNVDVT